MLSAIAAIRKEYQLRSLLESDVAAHPQDQFAVWWKEAMHSQIEEVNAMTLATVTPDGKPNARILLLKGFGQDGYTFFTNYESRKGNELAANPFATMVFFWKELERQVRIEGNVEKVSDAVSDAYFFSRPSGSRIGAWASPQSMVIENRNILELLVEQWKEKYVTEDIPRPPNWGGYILIPQQVEFWQGRPNRLHDRIRYRKTIDQQWLTERLAP